MSYKFKVSALGYPFTIDFSVEDYPINPREYADTVICTAHKNLVGDIDLGSYQNVASTAFEAFKLHLADNNLMFEDIIYDQVFLYQHGGYSFSQSPFSCQWDSGLLLRLRPKHS